MKRAAYSSVCAPTHASRRNVGSSTRRSRRYPRKLPAESRPFATATGTPAAPHSRTRFGQSSSSTNTSASGRTRRRNARTAHDKSSGARCTATPGSFFRATANPVFVETVTTGASPGRRSRSAAISPGNCNASPTLTACSQTHGSSPTRGSTRPVSFAHHPPRSLPCATYRHASHGEATIRARR